MNSSNMGVGSPLRGQLLSTASETAEATKNKVASGLSGNSFALNDITEAENTVVKVQVLLQG
jgi:hypothetical protein